MANSSYYRFTNTLEDLRDCYERMDVDLSDCEEESKKKLIALCKKIAEEYADD